METKYKIWNLHRHAWGAIAVVEIDNLLRINQAVSQQLGDLWSVKVSGIKEVYHARVRRPKISTKNTDRVPAGDRSMCLTCTRKRQTTERLIPPRILQIFSTADFSQLEGT
jgi:hypothetical protein